MMNRAKVELIPVCGIGEVAVGDDIAAIICERLEEDGQGLFERDIVVVSQKIVSKSEGRLVPLTDVEPSVRAIEIAMKTDKDPRLVELILSESSEIVRAVENVLITRHRLGLVMANAGIDRSNLGPDHDDSALLLPVDPDRSAARISETIAGRTGFRPPVVIADSCGRPWRHGVVGIAIGASGLPALWDQRGAIDRDGRALKVTQIALADILATAGGLILGEGAEGVPVAVVRGFAVEDEPRPAVDLVRPLDEDLFP